MLRWPGALWPRLTSSSASTRPHHKGELSCKLSAPTTCGSGSSESGSSPHSSPSAGTCRTKPPSSSLTRSVRWCSGWGGWSPWSWPPGRSPARSTSGDYCGLPTHFDAACWFSQYKPLQWTHSTHPVCSCACPLLSTYVSAYLPGFADVGSCVPNTIGASCGQCGSNTVDRSYAPPPPVSVYCLATTLIPGGGVKSKAGLPLYQATHTSPFHPAAPRLGRSDTEQ